MGVTIKTIFEKVDKMDNTKLLTILISITLIFTLINLSATVNIYNKINTLNTKSTPGQNAEQAATQALNTPTNTPQPSKVEVSIEDDPVKGSKDAPVTIVEFSDFQCPFCEKFFTQTLPLIEKNYIETGKVKLVYRDFPLKFHQYAQKAAEAAECGEEQGKFWEFHNKIYENQDTMNDESFRQYAKDLGLDMTEFNKCLDSGQMADEVSIDSKDGRSYGVTGTPTFFINGIKVTGVRPYSAFQQIIDQELNSSIG